MRTAFKRPAVVFTFLLLLFAFFFGYPAQNAAAVEKGQEASASADTGVKLKDGVYTGSGLGYRDNIVVEVTVSGGRISDIKIIEQTEDLKYFNRALAVLGAVTREQSTKVNAVSGATFSSKGILDAIDKALEKAREQANVELLTKEKEADETRALFSKMKLIISLFICLLMVLFLEKPIKKYPWFFYGAALLITVLSVNFYHMKLNLFFPEWVSMVFIEPILHGSFSTALFIFVMYAGALSLKRPFVQKLMRLRTELSILACIITLGHASKYGRIYFEAVASGFEGIPANYAVSTLITVVLLIIMIPLFVTSFLSVRKKMQPLKWKSLQKWAYPFYCGIYLHVASMYMFDLKKKAFEFTLYTLIFGLYAVLRIAKAYAKN